MQANVTNVAVQCSPLVAFLYQTTSANQLLSYSISAGTGALVPLGSPLATGANPAAMVTSADGKLLFVLNSLGAGNQGPGSISVYAVNADTGALTATSSVVTAGLNAGTMLLSPSGFLFVFGANLTPAPEIPPGSAELVTYAVDATTGALTPTGTSLTFPAGNGAGFAATPDGKFLYVLSGPFGSNTPSPITLTAYAIDPTSGALSAGPVTTLMSNVLNNNTIAIDPLGRFLYLTSDQSGPMYIQAAGTVMPYAIDAKTGALTAIGTGTAVASDGAALAPDPTGRYLYVLNELNSNAANDTVLALAVDQSNGVLTPIGSPLPTEGQPRSIICDPSGQFVYVGTSTAGLSATATDLGAYAISTDPATAGELVPIGQSGSFGATAALAVIE
jgi:6-phosphogluconolactonase (cycloisomerase 2 family)